MAGKSDHGGRGGASLDRKLGDEWNDWDGSIAGIETEAGKRLFVLLSWGLLAVVTALALLAWYMVAPRLSQWHAFAPAFLLGVLVIGVSVSGLVAGSMTFLLWRKWAAPSMLIALARRMLAGTERGVFFLGRTLSVDTDRAAHSLIKINNTLVRIDDRHSDPGRVLILLPRCLAREQIRSARSLAREHGTNIAVVPGGEMARQRIADLRPEVVIGVACERDLVSGLRDVGTRLRVLGIPNLRPNGPCKDTRIDMAVLQGAIETCVDRTGAQARASSARAQTGK